MALLRDDNAGAGEALGSHDVGMPNGEILNARTPLPKVIGLRHAALTSSSVRSSL